MAYTPKVLFATGFPSTAGTVLYTVPSGASAIVKNVVMTNTTGTDAWVHLSIVPQGDTSQASNRVLSSYNVPPNGISTLDCSIVMPANSYVHATNGTNNDVTLTVSGVEIT